MHVDMGFVFWPCTQDMATRRGQFGQLCWLHSATYDITIPGNDVVGHIIITAWVSKFATLTADDHPFPDGLIPLRCHRLHAERDLVDIKAVFFFGGQNDWRLWQIETERMIECVCVCLFFHLFELGMIFHVVFFRLVFVVYLFPNMILHNSYKRLQVYASFWNTICEHEAICENLKKAQAARKPRPSHRLYWFCKSLKLISAKKQNIYNTVL